MRRLAQEPNTEVLEYAFDSPERSSDAVNCVKLAQRVLELCHDMPPNIDRIEAKSKATEDPILLQFSKTDVVNQFHQRSFEHRGQFHLKCLLSPISFITNQFVLLLSHLQPDT